MQPDGAQFKQFFEQGIPFNRHLGLRLEAFEPGRVVLRLPFADPLVGDVFRPAVHGGAIAALVDAAAGAAVFSRVTIYDRVSTIDLRIDYLEPAPKRDLIATAELRRIGGRIAVVNVLVVPEGAEKEPVAEGRGVFSVRRDMGPPEVKNAAEES